MSAIPLDKNGLPNLPIDLRHKASSVMEKLKAMRPQVVQEVYDTQAAHQKATDKLRDLDERVRQLSNVLSSVGYLAPDDDDVCDLNFDPHKEVQS